MMRIKIPLIVLAILMTASVLAAQTAETGPQVKPRPAVIAKSSWPLLMIFGRYGSYAPSADIFKTIYGKGSIGGGEVRVHVKGGFYLSLEGGSFKKTGELTVTQDPTTMTIYPMDVTVIFHVLSGNIMPYVGAGGSACKYTEKNFIGTVKDWGFGFGVCGGITARWRFIGIDARVKYSSVKVKPLENRVDLGGLALSIGVGAVI